MRNMLSLKYLPILLSILCFGVNCAPKSVTSESPVVKTKSGELLGKVATTLLDQRKFYSFQGIPYAKPPVNQLRFRVSKFTINLARCIIISTNFCCYFVLMNDG